MHKSFLLVRILAIESSCDETSAAVLTDGIVKSNVIASQKVHEEYGGVVPELAGREHMKNIVAVVDAALRRADVKLEDIDAFAVTQAPGLIGALLVGVEFAKSLSLATGKPLIGVHHMQAHVLANLLGNDKPEFPFLCLTVSGGHTQIVRCNSPQELRVLGETIDDAAGEAFDKCAKLLGLPYPGGPLIDKYAKEGDPKRFSFPEPKIPGLDFSFSGLKTAILYFLKNAGASTVYKKEFNATEEEQKKFIDENLPDLCASIQHRIVTILINKLVKAAEETGIKNIAIAGGVSANSGLRNALLETGKKQGWKTFIPSFEYCTDNAAMIGIAAHYDFLAGKVSNLALVPSARAQW